MVKFDYLEINFLNPQGPKGQRSTSNKSLVLIASGIMILTLGKGEAALMNRESILKLWKF